VFTYDDKDGCTMCKGKNYSAEEEGPPLYTAACVRKYPSVTPSPLDPTPQPQYDPTPTPISKVGIEDPESGASNSGPVDSLQEEGSNNPTVLIGIVILAVLAMCAGTLYGMSGRPKGDKADPLGMADDANFPQKNNGSWSGEGLDKRRTEGLTSEGFQSEEGETYTDGETGYGQGMPLPTAANSRSRKSSICLGELDETTAGDKSYTPPRRNRASVSRSIKLSVVPDMDTQDSSSATETTTTTESEYTRGAHSE